MSLDRSFSASPSVGRRLWSALRGQDDEGRTPLAVGRTVRLADRRHVPQEVEPGEIVVLSIERLDYASADALVQAGVSAIVICRGGEPSRGTDRGIRRLAEGAIPIVELQDDSILRSIEDREVVRLYSDGSIIAAGGFATAGVLIWGQLDPARRPEFGADDLERFASNTLEYLRREAPVYVDPLEIPPLVALRAKPQVAVVVARGHDCAEDLHVLKSDLRRLHAWTIGVDDGADVLHAAGLRPQTIIGDFRRVSPEILSVADDLVHHVHSDGRAPGRERLLSWGVDYYEFIAEGRAEDAALLLAAGAGVESIVTIGFDSGAVDFFDADVSGAASHFFTQLAVGHAAINARGISRLIQRRNLKRKEVALGICFGLGCALLGGVVAVQSDELARVGDEILRAIGM